MNKHYPYKEAIMHSYENRDVWWPESSNTSDSMVIGSNIPGDKESAILCARCCNIAYGQAIDDVISLFKDQGMDVSKFLNKLTSK